MDIEVLLSGKGDFIITPLPSHCRYIGVFHVKLSIPPEKSKVNGTKTRPPYNGSDSTSFIMALDPTTLLSTRKLFLD